MNIKLSQPVLKLLKKYRDRLALTQDKAIAKIVSDYLQGDGRSATRVVDEIDHDYLLAKYKAIADFDPFDIMEFIESVTYDGEKEVRSGQLLFKSTDEWPARTKGENSPISSMKMTRSGLVVTAHDKLKALEAMGKHLGLFGDFNVAIGTLKKYGIELAQDINGNWIIVNSNPVQQSLDL